MTNERDLMPCRSNARKKWSSLASVLRVLAGPGTLGDRFARSGATEMLGRTDAPKSTGVMPKFLYRGGTCVRIAACEPDKLLL